MHRSLELLNYQSKISVSHRKCIRNGISLELLSSPTQPVSNRCDFLTAGRKQFARHEWAQKAAYLLGCTLEELSSSIFKHHPKGTLQRSTSFRQGPDDIGSGESPGALLCSDSANTISHYISLYINICVK